MMTSKGNPHPFVYWAQNTSHVLLRVDLKDVKVIIYFDFASCFASVDCCCVQAISTNHIAQIVFLFISLFDIMKLGS